MILAAVPTVEGGLKIVGVPAMAFINCGATIRSRRKGLPDGVAKPLLARFNSVLQSD